jgi:hypothetical protein
MKRGLDTVRRRGVRYRTAVETVWYRTATDRVRYLLAAEGIGFWRDEHRKVYIEESRSYRYREGWIPYIYREGWIPYIYREGWIPYIYRERVGYRTDIERVSYLRRSGRITTYFSAKAQYCVEETLAKDIWFYILYTVPYTNSILAIDEDFRLNNYLDFILEFAEIQYMKFWSFHVDSAEVEAHFPSTESMESEIPWGLSQWRVRLHEYRVNGEWDSMRTESMESETPWGLSQ